MGNFRDFVENPWTYVITVPSLAISILATAYAPALINKVKRWNEEISVSRTISSAERSITKLGSLKLPNAEKQKQLEEILKKIKTGVDYDGDSNNNETAYQEFIGMQQRIVDAESKNKSLTAEKNKLEEELEEKEVSQGISQDELEKRLKEKEKGLTKQYQDSFSQEKNRIIAEERAKRPKQKSLPQLLKEQGKVVVTKEEWDTYKSEKAKEKQVYEGETNIVTQGGIPRATLSEPREEKPSRIEARVDISGYVKETEYKSLKDRNIDLTGRIVSLNKDIKELNERLAKQTGKIPEGYLSPKEVGVYEDKISELEKQVTLLKENIVKLNNEDTVEDKAYFEKIGSLTSKLELTETELGKAKTDFDKYKEETEKALKSYKERFGQETKLEKGYGAKQFNPVQKESGFGARTFDPNKGYGAKPFNPNK